MDPREKGIHGIAKNRITSIIEDETSATTKSVVNFPNDHPDSFT